MHPYHTPIPPLKREGMVGGWLLIMIVSRLLKHPLFIRLNLNPYPLPVVYIVDGQRERERIVV